MPVPVGDTGTVSSGVPPAPAANDVPPAILRVAEQPPPRYQPAADASPPAPSPAERLARELAELDLEGMTPREALQWLFERQERLRDGG